MAKEHDAMQPKSDAPDLTQAPSDAELAENKETLKKMTESRYLMFRRIAIQLKPGYILRKVGQAYMVMPTGPRMKDYEGMITLNETGAFLYKELEKEDPSEEKLIEACKAEYGATDEEATQAVDLFIQQCANCGLLEYQDVIVDKETGEPVSQEEVDAQQEQ